MRSAIFSAGTPGSTSTPSGPSASATETPCSNSASPYPSVPPAGTPNHCRRCGRPLVPDEKALTKKMINRGTESFLCLSCLADHFDVPEEALRIKIEEFREMGCTLFSP